MTANPYHPLQPTEHPAYFYGREAVFAFFRGHFVGTPRDRALALTGRRGLGKSSVLRQLQGRVDDRYRVAVINLGAVDLADEAALIGALVDAVHLALEVAEASTYRLPDWPPATTESGEAVDRRAWFRDAYLDVALAALRGRFLVLALDDAHLLLEAVERGDLPGDLLDYFADLLARFESLELVLALDAAYEDHALSLPLLADPARQFRLAELAPDEAARLVHEPMEPVASYEPGVAEAMLARAGGHPFLLHSVCRLLFRRSEERNHAGTITLHDLDAVQEAVLDEADEVFAPLWAGLKRNEQLTLVALVRLSQADPGERVLFGAIFGWLTGAGYALNKTQLAAALRGLDYQGWVHAEADTYAPTAGLVVEWVAANAEIKQDEAARPAVDRMQLARLGGLLAVLLVVAILGAAVVGGVFDSDDEEAEPLDAGSPTATLSLNLEATRQSEAATQTEAARPTLTHTPTQTPSVTPTPSNTPSPTTTATPTSSATATVTPRPTRTPVITPPTATTAPTQTSLPTLDPGGPGR